VSTALATPELVLPSKEIISEIRRNLPNLIAYAGYAHEIKFPQRSAEEKRRMLDEANRIKELLLRNSKYLYKKLPSYRYSDNSISICFREEKNKVSSPYDLISATLSPFLPGFGDVTLVIEKSKLSKAINVVYCEQEENDVLKTFGETHSIPNLNCVYYSDRYVHEMEVKVSSIPKKALKEVWMPQGVQFSVEKGSSSRPAFVLCLTNTELFTREEWKFMYRCHLARYVPDKMESFLKNQ
jgi:hypothetical protein